MPFLPILMLAQQPEIDCYAVGNDTGIAGEARLARVSVARASFTPDARVAKPGTRPYVIKGDLLMIGKARGGFVPATYLGGKAVGCLPAAMVEPLPAPPAPRLADWAGDWFQGSSASMTLRVRNGRVHASGLATWSGGPMSMNTGDMAGSGVPRGSLLDLDNMGRCPMRLQLVGKYLVVSDLNGSGCNGVNVSFSGVYTRH